MIMPSYAVKGASRGIGLAFIKYLSSFPSSKVICLVRNVHSPHSPALFPLLAILEANVTSSTSVSQVVPKIAQITPSLDYLMNNAVHKQSTHSCADAYDV